jgi:hypothetical protein
MSVGSYNWGRRARDSGSMGAAVLFRRSEERFLGGAADAAAVRCLDIRTVHEEWFSQTAPRVRSIVGPALVARAPWPEQS